MAHKLYYDNVGSYSATIADGTVTTDGELLTQSFSASSNTITNESAISDGDTNVVISSFGTTDAIQFNFGSAKTINRVAVHFNAVETGTLRILHDSAASGTLSVNQTITDNFTAGWNIISLTSQSMQYWIIESEDSTISTITEAMFFHTTDNGLELPIDGAGVTINEPYNTFTGSTYNNTEFTNKVDDTYKNWQLKIPLLTESDKTTLETIQSTHSNLYPFLYYDESSYHTVRLSKPLVFNQVATNTYSTTLSLQGQA